MGPDAETGQQTGNGVVVVASTGSRQHGMAGVFTASFVRDPGLLSWEVAGLSHLSSAPICSAKVPAKQRHACRRSAAASPGTLVTCGFRLGKPGTKLSHHDGIRTLAHRQDPRTEPPETL
jgi:hypothetical protein